MLVLTQISSLRWWSTAAGGYNSHNRYYHLSQHRHRDKICLVIESPTSTWIVNQTNWAWGKAITEQVTYNGWDDANDRNRDRTSIKQLVARQWQRFIPGCIISSPSLCICHMYNLNSGKQASTEFHDSRLNCAWNQFACCLHIFSTIPPHHGRTTTATTATARLTM